jgi:hypothetical protein
MPYKFDCHGDDGDYQDFEFTNGDPCRYYRVTRLRDGKAPEVWFGIIVTSETPDGEFNGESEMPESLVAELRAIIPAETLHAAEQTYAKRQAERA